MAAVIGAYESVLAGHEKKLSKGENGIVAICAPTKSQGRIVKDYLRAIFDVPLLHQEVAKETVVVGDVDNKTTISKAGVNRGTNSQKARELFQQASDYGVNNDFKNAKTNPDPYSN